MGSDVLVSTATGLVLLILTLILSYYMPGLPPSGQRVLRILSSAGGGFLVFGLSGTIILGGGQLGLEIRATGGLAVFVLLYILDPPSRIARLRKRTGP